MDDEGAAALAEAVNLRAPGAGPAGVPEAAPPRPSAAALAELNKHLEAIASCLKLFSDRDRSCRDRHARTLIEAEIQRAARLSQGLAVLWEKPAPARGVVDLRRLVARVVETMGPERALTGHAVAIDHDSNLPSAIGDEHLLGLALAGSLAAMHALVDHVSGAVLECATRQERHSTVLVQIAEHALAPPPGWPEHLFDAGWQERPGGHHAAVGLLAARRVIELHAGTVSAFGNAAGCVLSLELPVAR